ncbi:2-oxo acid dehydrogenase subunit E2 [Psychrobacter pygoscelis]|uniref:2-oxo acid dehydrogenase subunit E2 n=1 Tax=Psychrobacter pygoscelis TaxID=2488563 RepID=UPI001039A256|nr:2-oxo acid dehydrogenase subunit E2 [Psychrobacter pygoscelis]
MEIKAPDLGVESAEVSEIMVSVGDVIAKDDNIVLLESDKASVEVPSSAAGKVTSIAISVGDQVSEGSVLLELEAADSEEVESDSDSKDDAEEQAAPANEHAASDSQKDKASETDAESSATSADSGAAEPTTYALPDLGVEEAQVAEVMVAVGDKVEAEQSILLIESDKASVEVPAPVSGTIEKILVNAGDTVTNGQDFIVIVGGQSASKPAAAQSSESDGESAKADAADKAAETKAKKQSPPAKPAPSQASSKKLSESEVNDKLTEVYAGPAVRKLARQLGIDITQVSGSAVNERIVKEDLFAYVKSRISGTAASASVATGTASRGLPNLPDMSKTEIWGETETVDLSRLQKVSIPQLNYNTLLPQVTQFDLADITDTEALRGELKGDFKKQGIGLTILAFIVKATAYALTQHPKFNSHLSDDNTQIIVRKSVNMGIAVATDDGLIVPVIKDAQAKGIKQLAIEIGELAAKARDKKLGTKDLQGASFTISSQGNLGGTYFTPLVNWPQVGILGISEATKQPRWNEEKQTFEPRLMLPLSLSYDHRVINGADAAVFTRYIAKLLADPRRILL